MALTPEDGTGVTGADSYISLQDALAYFTGRRLYSAGWTSASTVDKEIALRQASLTLDNEFTWSGTTPVSETQGLAWPFTDATDRKGNTVEGLPREIQYAACEVALYLLAQDRYSDQQGVGIDTLKVDTISIKFDKTESPRTFPPHVTRMLQGLGYAVKTSGTVRNTKLYRV